MTDTSLQATPPKHSWRLYIPKSITVIAQEGYRFADFRADALAGLTVAIVALPLAMAIAIASGTTPDKGLITAVIAGFLISALGGSRFQIGGPTGAFIVVVYGVIQQHGFDGLVLATIMAGIILVIAGLLRFGDWIKYIPEPVVTGFTAGIAVIIFTSQLRDLFGLQMENVPAEFIGKIEAIWAARDTLLIPAITVAVGALATIVLLRKFAPKLPGFLIAVAGAAAVVAIFNVPVETIGSRFGGVPSTLPSPVLPDITWERVRDLVQPAFTIAFLAGVESLLSAMVADGMTGRRHRSNCELVAQGVANVASGLFGGISATGAIARTATNIRAGGRTPVAGMLHALFILASMLALGPLMAFVPLASLAAVLVIVAWNMSEQERFRHLLSGPVGDRVVLLATFGLTVLVDLTVAIEVGIVLAAIIFMHRMAEATAIQKGVSMIETDQDDFSDPARTAYRARRELPKGVESFELRGPLFFGAASRLNDALEAAFPTPKAFILRFDAVPMVDVSGVGALSRFLKRCQGHDTTVFITELNDSSRAVLKQMKALDLPNVRDVQRYEDAIDQARVLTAEHMAGSQ
ncbi:MAG: SulP family inorganic anion transporter [Alphaproteobacteria bacterium]|nr:SulP family inorganic anion transporter [Alphaproteobacteria bacterium]